MNLKTWKKRKKKQRNIEVSKIFNFGNLKRERIIFFKSQWKRNETSEIYFLYPVGNKTYSEKSGDAAKKWIISGSVISASKTNLHQILNKSKFLFTIFVQNIKKSF